MHNVKISGEEASTDEEAEAKYHDILKKIICDMNILIKQFLLLMKKAYFGKGCLSELTFLSLSFFVCAFKILF